jgi:hypothetical protein
MKMTRFDHYQAAVRNAEEALEAMANAALNMKLAKIDARAGGYRHPSMKELESDLESLTENLKTAECGDCDKQITECECAWLKAEVR